MADTVSLWKAPQSGMAHRFLKDGFLPGDYPGFPGEIPDGRAYFALQIELAKEYAACYGAGIIDVRLNRSDYERHFQRFEIQYQNTQQVQVAIPTATFPC